MKKSELLDLVIKIIGLTLIPPFIRDVGQLITAIPFYTQGNFSDTFGSGTGIFYVITTAIIYILPLYLFLFKSGKVSQWLIHKEVNDPEFELGKSRADLIQISAIVAGGVTLLKTIPLFFYYASIFIQVKSTALPDEIANNNKYFYLNLTSVVLAIILIIYARQIGLYFGKKNVKPELDNINTNNQL